MRLLILGPPGAGKGTQAKRIAERFSIPAISTGDIFRANIKNETELGLQVKELLAAGQYVPDALTNSIVDARLREADAANGFLLDGYPRTPDQVRALDEMLGGRGEALNRVIELTVDIDELVSRLLKRAQIEGRSDDTEDVIRERMRVYQRETAPLAEVYRGKGLLVQVDGMGDIDAVTERIFTALES